MKQKLTHEALAQLFVEARTFNKFTDRAVTDEVIVQLYDLFKWGPTSMNSQPGRFIFLRSDAAKARLKPALSASNADKTMAAPVCVIVAQDSNFQEHITAQFPAYDAKPALNKRLAWQHPARRLFNAGCAQSGLGLRPHERLQQRRSGRGILPGWSFQIQLPHQPRLWRPIWQLPARPASGL
jgi:nitroreductase